MESTQITVRNQVGLHARPATLFVRVAQKHQSQITVSYGGETVNAKSLLALLSLGVTKDATITISANGSDEQVALHALTSLVESNFDE